MAAKMQSVALEFMAHPANQMYDWQMSTIDKPFDDLTLEELKSGLADDTIVIVDVREADEFARGHIPGAILNALSCFDVSALPAIDGKRVVISCRSGQRSRTALQIAHGKGRNDIRGHFPGGMLEWTGAGEPFEKN